MGSTFFGLVDMGLLGSSMDLLGSPSLVSYFILFINYETIKVISRRRGVSVQEKAENVIT